MWACQTFYQEESLEHSGFYRAFDVHSMWSCKYLPPWKQTAGRFTFGQLLLGAKCVYKVSSLTPVCFEVVRRQQRTTFTTLVCQDVSVTAVSWFVWPLELSLFSLEGVTAEQHGGRGLWGWQWLWRVLLRRAGASPGLPFLSCMVLVEAGSMEVVQAAVSKGKTWIDCFHFLHVFRN